MHSTRNTEQGRFLRSFVSEPVSSLVRPDDLAYCASRLLRLSQLRRRSDRGHSELIECALQDLARLDPENAVDRVHQAQQTWGESAETWALSCHVLAHTLSEFSREASTGVINELRSSLGDWYSRFRQAITARTGPADAVQHTLLQCYITQAAIFHDAQAMEWGCEQLLEALTPELMATDTGIESAELLVGLYSRPGDEAWRLRIRDLTAGSPSPRARTLAEQLGAALSSKRPGESPASTDRLSLSGEERDWRKAAAAKSKGKEKKKSKARVWIEDVLESYAWVVFPIMILGVGGLCVFGFGQFYDWFSATSPVGDQSLQQWYEGARAQRDARERGNDTSQGEAADSLLESDFPDLAEGFELETNAEADPVANAESPRPPPPPPEAEAGETVEEQFGELLGRHVRWMRPALAIPREVASLRQPGQTVEAWGEYVSTVHDVIRTNSRWEAIVLHEIRWIENGTGAGRQYIEVHYHHEGDGWELAGAARRLTPPQSEERPVYITEQEDLQWAEKLFEENPFY